MTTSALIVWSLLAALGGAGVPVGERPTERLQLVSLDATDSMAVVVEARSDLHAACLGCPSAQMFQVDAGPEDLRRHAGSGGQGSRGGAAQAAQAAQVASARHLPPAEGRAHALAPAELRSFAGPSPEPRPG